MENSENFRKIETFTSTATLDYKNRIVKAVWTDSYFSDSWESITDYTACECIVTSYGKVILENDKVLAIAGSYADETDNTRLQANGIVVIPKACIKEITSF